MVVTNSSTPAFGSKQPISGGQLLYSAVYPSVMVGLKSYLPVLAGHLNTTEDILYERQRKLTRAGLLIGSAGRGPGSGVRVNVPVVTLMVLTVMATDNLADADARAEFLAATRSDRQRCPLTGASTFRSALELVFASESVASTVNSIEVLRSTLHGEIWYRRKGRRLPEVSYFGREHGPASGLQSRCWLPGSDVLSISSELAAIAAGKPVNGPHSMEGKDAKG
jgi:hypothetical protein